LPVKYHHQSPIALRAENPARNILQHRIVNPRKHGGQNLADTGTAAI